MIKTITLFAIAILALCLSELALAQGQPNIGFETGIPDHWTFFTGICCPLNMTMETPAIPNRHTVTSGNARDPYGNFPIVSPTGGYHSFRLGNDDIGAEAERALYYVHVPADSSNYSLIYRYAIVLQDGGHDSSEQPRFAVNVYDSATGTPVSCAQFLYVASSKLPGFQLAPSVDSFADPVYYRNWTNGSINLSGFQGHTVSVVFSTGDCAQGGHFGYAYLDLSPGLFTISRTCNTAGGFLSGPDGFAGYYWYDSTFSTFIDSTQTITVPDSATNRHYAVILKPYAGYGCPDTLYTYLKPANSKLAMPPVPGGICDTAITNLGASVTGASGNVTYRWAPPGYVTCDTCQSTHVALPPEPPFWLVVTATDEEGCTVADSVYVQKDECADIWLPNAFTPNEDGLNDIFRIVGWGLTRYSNLRFGIYNRFGQRVFFTEDPYSGWNGKFNGIDQELGTYFYELQYNDNGKSMLRAGDLTLVR